MPRPAGRLRPALSVLLCVFVTTAGMSGASPALAGTAADARALTKPAGPLLKNPTGFHVPAKSFLSRGKGRPSGKSGPAPSYATAGSGGQSYLVADPPDGAIKSTWLVTYTGFESNPAAKAAFKAAVDIWARIVSSSVPIKVSAQFGQLPAGVLGGANACAAYNYQVGNGQQYYASALADALTGVDQSPLYQGQPDPPPTCDIDAVFTPDPDPDPAIGFYFGTDGATPAGYYDFESVVLHELGHGLGFSGSMDYSGGNGYYGAPPDIYDRFVYDAPTLGSTLLSQQNGSLALGTKLTNNAVYWGGSAGTTANGGTRPKLFAPLSWSGGSSIAHLDEATYPEGNPNSLMTPAITYQEAVHSPGPITVGIFNDMGWTASIPVAQPPGAPTAVSGGFGNAKSLVHWTAPVGSGVGTSYTVTANPGGLTCTATGGATSCTVGAVGPGLTNGQAYTFTVKGTNSAGPGPASAASAPVTPDGTAPLLTATSGQLAPVSLANPVISFSGSDTGGSGINDYLITYQVAPWNGTFTSATTTSTTANTKAFAIAKGSTLCLTIRSRDRALNLSLPSERRCTTVALDDRSLARSSGWGSTNSSAYYAGTATTIAHVGSTLTRTGVQTRYISLVATKCSTCGVVGVYWNGALLKQISLKTTSGTYQRQVILAYDLGAVHSGTLVIKTLNGSRVYIDGVGLRRP